MSKKILSAIIVLISAIVIFLSIDLILYVRLKRRSLQKETNEMSAIADRGLAKRDPFKYKPAYGSPFISSIVPHDTLPVEPETTKPIVTLKGIVYGPGDPVIVLQDEKGIVTILRKGETVNDITILAVTKNHVKVKYNDRSYNLSIWED